MQEMNKTVKRVEDILSIQEDSVGQGIQMVDVIAVEVFKIAEITEDHLSGSDKQTLVQKLNNNKK